MKKTIKQICLAGDSIFDNDGYVMGEPGVIEQLRTSIPPEWSAMKIAVDGDCIRHVYSRIENFPTHVTDLVLSIGGNDAIGYSEIIDQAKSIEDLKKLAQEPASAFRDDYRKLLNHLLELDVNLHVCTVYTAVPFPDPIWRQYVPLALAYFNNIIVEEAAAKNVPVVHLENVCTDDTDFAEVSPIEPSVIGGQKIVDAIIAHLS